MANTFFAIAKVLTTSNQTDINFTGIPQTYDDLVIFTSLKLTGSFWSLQQQFTVNATGGTNYAYKIGGSTGATANPTHVDAWASSNGIYQILEGSDSLAANIYSSNSIYIPNYSTTGYKPVYVDGNTEGNINTAGTVYRLMIGNNVALNAAITSLQFPADPGSSGRQWVAGSRIDIYGIKRT